MNILLIAAGGALGAVARYGLSGWLQERAGFFPWGTLAVNVLGSFLLGLTFRYLEATALPAEWRQAATIGFLGAFTTFSTFSYEAVALVQDGDWGRAGAYVGGSVLLGLAAVVAGLGMASLSLHAR
ncbi:MAG: fluoride efflux transporter CrcB [Gemmatimonadetes bacterium]|nr:fluoride efflux transporter CrcB [Gemmatimonadota bacterium]NIQ52853.1 fluoride efflux transporter CrcB [Gemmatimonadota bacterium]NIU72983.1 fluoride efflux transporter CrcB [Gammaproteobacteria bacterium]NIX43338.1 fluoride efflux transporter CrcB [Gemmatimonadota bacterium]NIY11355.1 fluoride efflux transporter CrcB [Gemmatimonadota bacterium]